MHYYVLPDSLFLFPRTSQILRLDYIMLDVSFVVPEGPALGPLFFKIFINDPPSNVDTKVVLSADDTPLLHEVTT